MIGSVSSFCEIPGGRSCERSFNYPIKKVHGSIWSVADNIIKKVMRDEMIEIIKDEFNCKFISDTIDTFALLFIENNTMAYMPRYWWLG